LPDPLQEALKEISEVEAQAKTIINEAKIEAEKILRTAGEKSKKAYADTYKEEIAKAKKEASKLIEKAKTEAERQAQRIHHDSAEKIKSIQKMARERSEKVVDLIFQEILSVIGSDDGWALKK